jgi:cellulose synthase/poly-beta-1,6-N-acetylglucosamine synthase-like glycosyltransferase
MIDEEGREIKRVFDDIEKALKFAKSHGYRLKAIRRADYLLGNDERRKALSVLGRQGGTIRSKAEARPPAHTTSELHAAGLNYPFVSILVACKAIGAYEKQCIEECLKLDYPNFELLILPDVPVDIGPLPPQVRVVSTGRVAPSLKRSIGLSKSRGEVIAFLDSDAYPRRDWLHNAVKLLLKEPEVAIVGGPTLTPKEDSIFQKASGHILSSYIGSGTISYRYSLRKARETDDLPTCNLVARREVLERLARQVPGYWPGEDTLLCMRVREEFKMKILYSPDVVVYHHRRPLFRAHLRQIWGYGLHRGYFTKKFPRNSRKPIYFLPSLFLLFMGAGFVASLLFPSLSLPYLGLVSIYFISCLFEGAKTKHAVMTLLVAAGIILTHLVYGLAFLRGIMAGRLQEEGITNGLHPNV